MRPLLVLGAVTATSLSVGCAVGNPDAPDAEVQTAQTATAIVSVERTTSGDAVVARFLRARQGETMYLGDLGDLGLHFQDLPVQGTCTTSFDSPSSRSPASRGGIDLLDVGAVTIDTTPLLPRAMPDPAGMISGTFYTARTAEAFSASSRLSLRASGGQDLSEGFDVSVTAPPELADVRAAFVPAGLDVSWSSSSSSASEAASSRDVVYVDVLGSAIVVRCTAGDNTTRLTVPASFLASIDEGNVTVHRVHREPFRARGIDNGEVRFDLARVTTFRR
jgi:hypothetical protein